MPKGRLSLGAVAYKFNLAVQLYLGNCPHGAAPLDIITSLMVVSVSFIAAHYR